MVCLHGNRFKSLNFSKAVFHKFGNIKYMGGSQWKYKMFFIVVELFWNNQHNISKVK